MFTTKITPLIRPIFYLSLLCGVILYIAIFVSDGWQFDIKMVHAVLAFESVVFPFCFLIALIGAIMNKITIENHSISSRNPFSNKFEYESLNWTELATIKTKNFLGYKYYFLQSYSGKGIWVPTEIKDKEKFKNLVKTKTGKEDIFEKIL